MAVGHGTLEATPAIGNQAGPIGKLKGLRQTGNEDRQGCLSRRLSLLLGCAANVTATNLVHVAPTSFADNAAQTQDVANMDLRHGCFGHAWLLRPKLKGSGQSKAGSRTFFELTDSQVIQ